MMLVIALKQSSKDKISEKLLNINVMVVHLTSHAVFCAYILPY